MLSAGCLKHLLQVKLRHGDLEVRLQGEPFPLYPGERLHEVVTKLRAVPRDTALRLQALEDFKEGEEQRLALDQWLFEGPGSSFFPLFY